MNDNIYQERLMYHYKYPKNRKKINNPDFSSGQQNPSCGDRILIEGKFEKSDNDNLVIKDLGFDGSGCVISQAVASILTQYCIDKSVNTILKMNKDDIIKLIKIPLGLNRIKCALLSLEALKAGLNKIKKD